jgi:hypothetical protein
MIELSQGFTYRAEERDASLDILDRETHLKFTSPSESQFQGVVQECLVIVYDLQML